MNSCGWKDCEAKYYASGYCRSHYDKAKRGTLDRKPVPCAFGPCDRLAAVKGYCKTHYKHVWAGRELAPIGKKVRLEVQENGRVCTECMKFKTWDQYYMNSNGKPRSKCKGCIIKINLRVNQNRRNKEAA